MLLVGTGDAGYADGGAGCKQQEWPMELRKSKWTTTKGQQAQHAILERLTPYAPSTRTHGEDGQAERSGQAELTGEGGFGGLP
jgi:hypothetical protein